MVKKAQAQKSSKKDDKSKQIKKDTNTKATKKSSVKAVGPMKAKNGTAAKDKSSNLLELGLLCDCTSSMGTWIERAKTTLKEIITNVV